MISVTIDDSEDQTTRALWSQVGALVEALPSGVWVLVGGLMVQLHALEHHVAVRVTKDIDLLGQARPPGKLEAIDRALRGESFELAGLDQDGYGYRYERDGIVVDLLAPDGMRTPPTIRQGVRAIGIPGGSQALARSEPVQVTISDRRFVARRPNLLGAILIKARSLMVHSDPASQREDLLRLLSLVPDPRAIAAGLSAAERRWLTRAQARLNFEGPSLLNAGEARTAALACRLLSRPAADRT